MENGRNSTILSERLVDIAGAGISLQTLLSAATIIAATALAVWVIRVLVTRSQQRLGEAHTSAIYVGGQVLRYVVIFIGLAATVSTLGIDLSALSLFAGALGVGIGLGLQDIVKNFVCGIILLFDSSIEVGDYVELEDGTAGEVSSIGPRATALVTTDNVDILVPNASLLSGKLTNWTRNRATRRIHVPFSVAYGSDKEIVKLAALEAAHTIPFTMQDDAKRKAQVWLKSFGDSALNFELVVWPTLEAVKRPGSMMAAYCWALDDALRNHSIEIPFAQHDVRLRSFFGHEGQAAIDKFHNRNMVATEARSDRMDTVRGTNDAAQDVSPD